MVGLREAGLLGASVAVAGGVAYFIWSYASSSGHKERAARASDPRQRPGGDREEEQEEQEKSEEVKEQQEQQQQERSREEVVAEQSAHVSAAAAPKPPESSPAGGGGSQRGTQVLVLGLDGAGKTSLLQCWSTGGPDGSVQPTQGFNAVSINREELHVEFLEIGGRDELRPYWQRYMSKAMLLVFVLDSSQPPLFPVAKKHLHELLASNPCLPLMVLANKQDLPGACSITDVHEALALSDVGDRQLFLIGTYVMKGAVAAASSGVQDAQEFITQMVCEGR